MTLIFPPYVGQEYFKEFVELEAFKTVWTVSFLQDQPDN